jgi:beta-glucosidase
VDFAPGFGVDDPDADDAALLAEAVEAARAADTVLVFLGPAGQRRERGLRPHPHRPACHPARGARRGGRGEPAGGGGARQRIGVVAVHGWLQRRAPAILEAWLGGQAGGGGVADVLLGTVNPVGRLTETIPRRLADTPAHLHFPGEERQVRYGEGVFVGYRHHDAVDGEVSYPFGHGLSYTTFAHTDLGRGGAGSRRRIGGGGRRPGLAGGRPRHGLAHRHQHRTAGGQGGGAALRGPHRRHRWPAPCASSRAFTKVALEPTASTRVSFTLTERDLSRWSVRAGGWVLEPGGYRVDVGASSGDLRLGTEVVLGGAPPVLPLDRHSSIGEWLEHPVGRDVLLEALRAAPGGDLTPLFANPEQLRTIASFPLPRLMTMMGGDLGDGGIDALLAAVHDAVTPAS